MSIEPGEYARLRRAAERLSGVPGVGKVEIAGGAVRLSLPPVERHELAALAVAGQLNAQLPRTHPDFSARGDTALEAVGLGRLCRPDLLVFAETALESGRPTLAPHEVLLVVEIVRQSAEPAGAGDYAAMGIPFHLLVDPRDGTGVVHDEPGYTSRKEFAFGDTVTVGPWTIDTSGLLTYA
ncbi:hypothetical protein GCM10009639_60100 [Kitasatospora putterlickiae]|uniref:Putative restriction endonuclease domain-containing protein n=1 Tax=Kitasatospora putterlickiae TaxID=221725 RepID=A0ABP4J3S4_9ACTN